MIDAPRPNHAAFTLVECAFALAVLGLAVAATAGALAAGQAQTCQALYEIRAESLAEALMDEIVVLPCLPAGGGNNLGFETGETRQTCNSVDDFNGLTETSTHIKDAAGILYSSDYQGFSRTVSVVYGNITLGGYATPVAGATVTVTVTDGHGGSWALARFVPQ